MIRGKSLISFSVSLHIMTSYIWDICYQLCCHSLSNFEPEALPHHCRSSPNPFTSSSSSEVISWEIFTLHFLEKMLLWVVIVLSEKVFLYFGGICYHTSGDLWWPIDDQRAVDLLPLTLYTQYVVPWTSQCLPYDFTPYYAKGAEFSPSPSLLTTCQQYCYLLPWCLWYLQNRRQ